MLPSQVEYIEQVRPLPLHSSQKTLPPEAAFQLHLRCGVLSCLRAAMNMRAESERLRHESD